VERRRAGAPPLVGLLKGARITGWRLGHVVEGYLPDVAFPAARLAIEVDGWAWHRDGERSRAGRRRRNALVAAGWTVPRFTWYDLTERPAEVLTEVVAALRRAAVPRRPGPPVTSGRVVGVSGG
jgi:very-short-patch-repair endonuclease